MRDHGGNIDEAIRAFGGAAAQWIDLSTGINRQPYPMPQISAGAWTDLPTVTSVDRLSAVAAQTYHTSARVLPVAGAQAAIQIIPFLRAAGRAAVLGPTYNEHAAALRFAGWDVVEVETLGALAGVDLAVVVNPNNPDGRVYDPQALLKAAQDVNCLVVDESFVDATPAMSLAPHVGLPGVLVLRSVGKFYGLAGLRLGFVIGNDAELNRIAGMAGPWCVSGVALEVGAAALADHAWYLQTQARLLEETHRLDQLAERAGWELVGGTALFRTYDVGDAVAARDLLARQQIWSRVFPYSGSWLRLGLPGGEVEWTRLEAALIKVG